jgi:pimeloyl-ACP methyl ester carboxylesterase
VADTTAIVLPTRRGRFHALAAGGVDRPTLLILHGFPDSPTTFQPLVGALAAAGYRAVAPWMRGYGPAPSSGPYTIESLADDVAACLDVLSPGVPARVLGHDWGAIATYAAGVGHQERIAAAVTLSVPHPFAFLRNLHAQQLARSWYMLLFQLPGAAQLARTGDFAFIDRLWRRWSPGYRLAVEQRRGLHRDLAASWPAPLQYYRSLLRPARTAIARVGPGSEARRRIQVPTLYLHGADDGCVGVEVGLDAERHFAGPYRREVVNGAGHFLAAEAPEQIAERATAWFQQMGG